MPLAGGTPVNLYVVNNCGTTWFSLIVILEIAPDSSRVVYGIDFDCVVYCSGSGKPGSPEPGGSTLSYALLSNSRLFSVPVEGGVPVELEEAFGHLGVSPDSSRVVYVASSMTSKALVGGTGAVLAERVSALAISPDSSRVIFRADPNNDSVYGLYSVPLAGGVIDRLSGSAGCSESTTILSFAVSPDSSRVVYVARGDLNSPSALYSVPLAGGSLVRISGPAPAPGAGIFLPLVYRGCVP